MGKRQPSSSRSRSALFRLAGITFFAWDVYIFLSCAAVAVVPLFLAQAKRPGAAGGIIAMAAVGGVIAGLSNLVRYQSGTAVVIFLAVFTVLSSLALRRKAVILIVMLTTYVVPSRLASAMVEKRDNFLVSQGDRIENKMEHHVVWGAVYAGLGFLKNPYGLAWDDPTVIAHVRAVDPNVIISTPGSEKIFKALAKDVVRSHPLFVVETVAVKAALIILFFIAFSNVGLYCFCVMRRFGAEDGAFLAALAFHSLYGLLVIPHPRYLMGFFAFSTLFGLVKMGRWSEWKSGSNWKQSEGA